MSADTPIVTFVDPGPLSRITRACLKSAVRCGHQVHVYAYGEVTGLPVGVVSKDAEDVIPKSEMFTFDGITQPGKFGSLAPFADALRYRLLKSGLGIWVDWDVYFIKPIDVSKETILSWEGKRQFNFRPKRYEGVVGNAVMRLATNSPVLSDLVDLTSPPYRMPPWLPPELQDRVRKKLNGGPFYPGAITYAEYGPIALTYFVKKHRLKSKIRSFKYHYPVSHNEVSSFLLDDQEFRGSLPGRTQTIHLWNSLFQEVIRTQPPKKSFAARLLEESLDA